jgi:carbonic anhydrase
MCEQGDGIAIDRRTALLGAACLAVSATLPGAAAGSTSSRSRGVQPRPHQSPIDLRRDRVDYVRRLPRIRFRYPRSADVTLVNTGAPDEFATVRAEVEPGTAHIAINGDRWELAQFHWHTPSEHELDGRGTPMEMHLVHTRADGALLVVAVFMRRGAANEVLAPMFSDLPSMPDATREVSGVRIKDLLPEGRDSYRYRGSLTTPPFSEPVRFVVMADPIAASRRQIRAFKELFPEGNSRETQPLNGRTIRSDARRPRD